MPFFTKAEIRGMYSALIEKNKELLQLEHDADKQEEEVQEALGVEDGSNTVDQDCRVAILLETRKEIKMKLGQIKLLIGEELSFYISPFLLTLA